MIKKILFSTLLLLMSMVCASAASTPVSQYDFENNLVDTVSGFNGMEVGAVAYASGIQGEAVVLNGSQYITLPLNAWSAVYSNNAIFNFSINPSNVSTSYGGILGVYYNNTNRFLVYMERNPDTHLVIRYVVGEDDKRLVYPMPYDGAWHNISITTGRNGLLLMDNGKQVSRNAACTYAVADVLTVGAPTKIVIGTIPYNNSSMGNYEGLIDSVNISYTQPITPITQRIKYASTQNTSLNSLYATVSYNVNETNLPIIVMLHGFGGTANDFNTTVPTFTCASGYTHYFCIAPELRGRSGSDGVIDYSGMEAQDVIDAIEYVKTNATLSQHINPDIIYAYGISFGGDCTYVLGARYPDYFSALSINCAVADVGKWYYDVIPDSTWYQISLNTTLGGSPVQIPYRYYARSPYNSSSSINAINNYKVPAILFHGSSDTLVPESHTTTFENLVGTENKSFYIWSNFTHGYGNVAAFPFIDTFYSRHQTHCWNFTDTNLTILGYIKTSDFNVSIYNETYKDTVSDIGYIDTSDWTIKVLNPNTQHIIGNTPTHALYNGLGTQILSTEGNTFNITIPQNGIIAPTNSVVSSDDSISVNISQWGLAGTHQKVWVESSEIHDAVARHIIGDFPANTPIQIKRDGVDYTVVTSNETGYIDWTYDGGYSEHTFEAIVTTAAAATDYSFAPSWLSTIGLVGVCILLTLVAQIVLMLRGKGSIKDIEGDVSGIVIVLVIILVGTILFSQL